LTLVSLPVGVAATVNSVDASEKRLLGDIGIFAGREVEVIGRFPFGGPLLIQVGDSLAALEPAVARRIEVTL